MAIDFQQIYTQIKEFGVSEHERKEKLKDLRERTRNLFDKNSGNLDGIRQKIEDALREDANIRCAYPLSEALNTHIPVPAPVMDATLIATDGSQIVPSRQDAELFGLVNIGAIVMQLNSGDAPEIFTDSNLIYGNELFVGGSIIGEGEIALRRDTDERIKLTKLAKRYPSPVITFMDGTLALWGSTASDKEKLYRNRLEKYKAALYDLQKNNGVIAGYVDKPTANYVVRLLEIMQTDTEDIKRLKVRPPFLGVSDRWLFGDRKNPLLKPGERSAIFELQAKVTKEEYTDLLSIHFFYLNVGTEGHPYPVRVEVPKWVVDDNEKIKNLHAVLVQQAQILGSKPYPYLLHRAHEVAVVSFQEKKQIEQMLALEFGGSDQQGSKKVAKDSSRK